MALLVLLAVLLVVFVGATVIFGVDSREPFGDDYGRPLGAGGDR